MIRSESPWRSLALLGVISFLIAIASEPARAAGGPLLQSLGAGAAAVGLVAGCGEFLGYTLRLGMGTLADRPGGAWRLLAAGTATGLIAVVLLARANGWEGAAVLLILERLGRAVRAPARDVMLASMSTEVGHGRGFGVHRLFDQAGGIVGPLALATLLGLGLGYRRSLTILVIPAAGSLVLLATLRGSLEAPPCVHTVRTRGLPREFFRLCAIAALLAAGTADFALIAYHYIATGSLSPPSVQALYAVAMSVEAVTAATLGFVLHKWGPRTLLITVSCSATAGPLVFGDMAPPWFAIGLWSAGMGGQYLVLRALVPQTAPADRWGVAFGWFNAFFGMAWFAGSSAMGLVYARHATAVGYMAAALQLSAIPFVFVLERKISRSTSAVDRL